ncbi:V-type proton ATPase subunit H-like isoform X1 [Penaeus japonicus]|uniref:V-type proton ATPase subunit H-like isoform X1 n=1 Tax=Penaeus japonicus TaxID=27405 RepID=UPI001C70B029|nr:V-type proton ATPase subunit H-like isoform X1 [Penaeus japonicus]
MSNQLNMPTLPEDIDRGVAGATSVLVQRANEIRLQKVNWPSYLQSQMISQEDYEVIVGVDQPGQMRETLLTSHRYQVARTFMNLLGHISKDQTIQYILTLVDDILSEDKARVEIFKEYARKHRESMWSPFLNLLTRPDTFIINMTARIIAKLACWSREPMDGSDLTFYLTWLKDQLRTPNNEYMQSVGRCLQMMLRVEEYRTVFYQLDGVVTIVQVLSSGKLNFQIQYQLTFCLWVMTFNNAIAEKMNKYSVIPTLADILSESVKEKVTRITLAVFRNLIEKPEDPAIARENSIQMVQCKVLKQLEILAQRKFEDEDITADIEFLNEKLQTSIQDLSSFEEYCSEVKSGRMEWSPVHKSEKFWRENAERLNEKNYELLKILINLLETSNDPLVLSVACHDIGEYTRHYSRGKKVLEQLGGKQLVMQHLTHPDPNVRYEALLAVQKLMVHNWEYLGKQLEKDAQQSTPRT